MTNKKGRMFIIAGLLLIAAALFITVFNIWESHKAGSTADKILSGLEAAEKGAEAIPEYVLDPYMDMPTVSIDGAEYIGTLEIPSLELTLPVAAEMDYGQLRKSPCRYTGSAYLHNMVIGAHNYTVHFGKIARIKTGEKVIFTDAAGNRFEYIAAGCENIDDTAVEEMINTEWDLTLFTCTIGGQARIAVRCQEK